MSLSAIVAGLMIQSGAFDTLTVNGFGDIGVKKLNTAERDAIYKDFNDQKDEGGNIPISAFILKNTLIDLKTGDLALLDISLEDLAKLPPSITDEYAEKTYYLNGFARKKSDAEKDIKN